MLRHCLLAFTLSACTALLRPAPAAAQLLIGPQAELGFVRGPEYPENPEDSAAGLLGGIHINTSIMEFFPAVLISQGRIHGGLMDVGLRITPTWFGQPEYLFRLVSPYAVLGGSVGYPWSAGWYAKAGLGLVIMRLGSVNAEIGYRSHRLTDSVLMEGVTLGVRASYPF